MPFYFPEKAMFYLNEAQGEVIFFTLSMLTINNYFNPANTLATVSPIADGVGQIVTPKSLSIATFSAALSPAEEIIAPA
jgi:hypothetical protein